MDAYEVLLSACSTLGRTRKDAEIEQLATHPDMFDARCSRFARTNSSGNEVNVDWGSDQEKCRSAWRLRENTRARVAAEAKGLRCFGTVVYSPERPECVSKAEFDRRMTPVTPHKANPTDMSWMDKGTSLMIEAESRAKAMIVRAKEQKAGAAPTRISVDQK